MKIIYIFLILLLFGCGSTELTQNKPDSKFKVGDIAYLKIDSVCCVITDVEYNGIGGSYQYSIKYSDKNGVIRTERDSGWGMFPENLFH